MVTFERSTVFVIRHEAGKREMTRDEIRSAFRGDFVGRSLEGIEGRLSTLTIRLAREEEELLLQDADSFETVVLEINHGEVLARELERRVANDVGAVPFFWLGATAVQPRRGLLAVDEDAFREAMRSPGGRRVGWTVQTGGPDPSRSLTGLQLVCVIRNATQLQLIPGQPGTMGFYAPIRFGTYPGSHFRSLRVRVRTTDITDDTARQLLSYIYRAFGLREIDVSFFTDSGFEIPE